MSHSWKRRTHIGSIMHDTPVVIRNIISVDLWGGVLIEVEFHPWYNIACVDGNITVAVRSGLLMLESNCMTQLMHHSCMLEGQGLPQCAWDVEWLTLEDLHFCIHGSVTLSGIHQSSRQMKSSRCQWRSKCNYVLMPFAWISDKYTFPTQPSHSWWCWFQRNLHDISILVPAVHFMVPWYHKNWSLIDQDAPPAVINTRKGEQTVRLTEGSSCNWVWNDIVCPSQSCISLSLSLESPRRFLPTGTIKNNCCEEVPIKYTFGTFWV